MNTERETIGGEHRKRGNLEIKHPFSLSPEGPKRIITPDGLVQYGKKIQGLIIEEGDKAKAGADMVLAHITGKSPENIAFMKQSGIDQKLVETAGQIDALVETNQKEIAVITEIPQK